MSNLERTSRVECYFSALLDLSVGETPLPIPNTKATPAPKPVLVKLVEVGPRTCVLIWMAMVRKILCSPLSCAIKQLAIQYGLLVHTTLAFH